MLQVLQLLSCGLFTLAICFYFGKRWGERKFLKMKEEMKAYETAFTQLIEQMELVSKHNLKVLETKTEELRELIPVIDKKLLYADDLMREMENTKTEMGRPGKLKIDAPSDLRLRREMQELISNLRERMSDLEERLEVMENLEHERGLAPQMTHLDGKVSVNGRDNFFGEESGEKLEMSRSAGEKIVKLPEKMATESVQANVKMQMAKPNFASDSVSQIHSAVVFENSAPTRLRHEPPRPGTVLHEVLVLHSKGISLSQIARQLNMSNGEVEVIMNIYGSKPSMRKIS